MVHRREGALQPSQLAHAATNRTSALPPEHHLELGSLHPSNEVPVIDLTSGDSGEIARTLRNTCGTGFFYVAGHGVPQSLVDSTFDANRHFFSLPVEKKQKLRADKAKRGWTPHGGEWLDPSKQKQGDTKEGFYVGRDYGSSLPDAAKPIHKANQWPDEQLVPGFRDTLEQYMEAMHILGNRLLSLIAVSLDIDADSFATPFLFLRPIRYLDTPSSPAEGVFAAGAHTDFGMLTILASDEVPGLQIFTPGNGWASVPPKRGCFVINLGDMMERWSDGIYQSTLHRVVNTTGQERYSIACFF